MGTETCPECQGTPEREFRILGPDGCRKTTIAREFCGGFGIVPVEAAERYRKGRALRKEPVHNWGLRQEQLVRRLGISPQELDDIERGLADMPADLISRLISIL
jgi:hypothetical protein